MGNNKGFTLIGLIITAGVGSIIMAALTSQILSSNQQIRFLEAKMESANFKQELMSLLTRDTTCETSFTGITGIDVADDALTNISSTLPPTNSLRVLKENYSANNRYLDINTISLLKPALRLDGNPNVAPIYEFQIKAVAKVKGSEVSFYIDGPRVDLRLTGTSVDAVDACVPRGPAAAGTRTVSVSATAWRWPAATANCNPDEKVLGGGATCSGGGGFNFLKDNYPIANGWTASCDTPWMQTTSISVYAICAR